MNPKVLLVEDEAIIGLNEKKILEQYGYQIKLVFSGEQAISVNKDEIDLVLMDIDLGKGITGVEAAEKILKQKELPLVFLSSHSEPEIVETTEKVTSYGYILKDSGITVMLASIKMALKLFNAKMELKEKEESYKSMFLSNPHPMWVYDLETLDFLMVNDAAKSIYGYTEEEYLEMKIIDIRPQEDIPRLKENIEKVSNGLDHAGKWRHRFKNGKEVYVEIISHTITWMGRKAEVVLSLIESP